MHYNLLFNGCSFTFGQELEGKDNNFQYRNEKRFSHLIAEKTNQTYDNISLSGNSNDRIARETLDWFNKGNTCDLAIIQFTNVGRIEYVSRYEKHPVNFCIQSISLNWKSIRVKDHIDAKNAHNHYYKHVYNNNLGVYNFYKNLFILEQYFQKNNIKHLLIKLDINQPWLIEKEQKLNLVDDTGNKLDFYWKKMCTHDYFDIPSIRGNMIDIKNRKHFTPNYTNEGYKSLPGGHPSELGHQKIADFIISKIQSK